MTTYFRRTAGIALVAAVLAGCGTGNSSDQDQPRQNLPTTTVNPMGPNSFTPSIKAPGPQTALPGNVVTGN